MVAPPAIPLERLKILRAAYTKTLRDTAFLAEIKKLRLKLNPSTGEELQADTKMSWIKPAEVDERGKKLLRA